MTVEATGGGGAPRPVPAVSGPVPADLAELLPDGFELPEGVQLVYVPPVTPEAHAIGLREHADREAERVTASAAHLKWVKEQAAAAIASAKDGLDATKQEAAEADRNAAGAERAAGIERGDRAEGQAGQ